MTILAAQSIDGRCHAKRMRRMIEPYYDKKVVINGISAGLSACTYDLRIAEDVVLGPARPTLWQLLKGVFKPIPPSFELASTIEYFDIPHDICGFICDKSTYARYGVSLFNTLFDPGFRGYGTLELANLSNETVHIRKGDPICQMVFFHLDRPTIRPYQGKYQNQAAGPQAPRRETIPSMLGEEFSLNGDKQ